MAQGAVDFNFREPAQLSIHYQQYHHSSVGNLEIEYEYLYLVSVADLDKIISHFDLSC